ncbi:MAG TPA: PDZ domain-containing protein [Gemmatimonadaceae bacterium]|nr:PDZ domain-containing protein [Gemmatimonadaceae bacterium]
MRSVAHSILLPLTLLLSAPLGGGLMAQEAPPPPPMPPPARAPTPTPESRPSPSIYCGTCDSLQAEALQHALDGARRDLEQSASALQAANAAVHAADDSTLRAAREALSKSYRTYEDALRKYQVAATQAMRYELQVQTERVRREQREQARLYGRRSSQGWLGVTLSGSYDITDDEGKAVMRFKDYPVIETVEPESPADRGGVESRDVLVKLAGRDVRDGVEPLYKLLKPGSQLVITVKRGRTLKDLTVLVAKRPDSQDYAPDAPMQPMLPFPPPVADAPTAPIAPKVPAVPNGRAPQAPEGWPTPEVDVTFAPPVAFPSGVLQVTVAGAQLQPVAGLEDYFGVSKGLVVLHVLPGTPAARAGLKGGDVIQRVDGQAVTTPIGMARVLERSQTTSVTLDLVRKRQKKSLTLAWER